jgi:hypothetical protein
MDRAGITGRNTDWAEDHAEADFHFYGMASATLDEADGAEMSDAEVVFEDDLLSLIMCRPSRRYRTN